MSDADWEPFGLTAREREEFSVLLPGVPRWLREPLIAWLRPFLFNAGWVNIERCLEVQLQTRVDLTVGSVGAMRADPVLGRLRNMGGLELLRVVDYVVSRRTNVATAARLEAILVAGRSKWRVGQRPGNRPGLVERVPAGVQDSVEAVISETGSAGRVLGRSWANVHGLEQNDSAAYADAVRAVEIAAIEVIQPTHATATLGTVLGQMKADGDWRLPLREHAEAPGAPLILAMIRTLWYGHRDRHGGVDYKDVTHEEARAAVMLAGSLVDWFASGALRRRPADKVDSDA